MQNSEMHPEPTHDAKENAESWVNPPEFMCFTRSHREIQYALIQTL